MVVVVLSLCRPGWRWSHRDLPVSVSQISELHPCTSRSDPKLYFFKTSDAKMEAWKMELSVSNGVEGNQHIAFREYSWSLFRKWYLRWDVFDEKKLPLYKNLEKKSSREGYKAIKKWVCHNGGRMLAKCDWYWKWGVDSRGRISVALFLMVREWSILYHLVGSRDCSLLKKLIIWVFAFVQKNMEMHIRLSMCLKPNNS